MTTKKTTAKATAAPEQVKAADTPETFYPKDAQERNFESARQTAIDNHEKDMATRSIGLTDEDEVVKAEAVEVINPVATPDETTEDK